MTHKLAISFRIFLMVYGCFLVSHLLHTGVTSLGALTALFGGLAVAVMAHKGHGFVPLVFLFLHMTLEWYNHAKHGNHYAMREYTFHGIHACLDLVFLSAETYEHYKKYTLLIVGSAVAVLGLWFWYFYEPAPVLSSLLLRAYEMKRQLDGGAGHVHGGGPIHHFVIGGMLGCVIYQLFLVSRWKHVHTH